MNSNYIKNYVKRSNKSKKHLEAKKEKNLKARKEKVFKNREILFVSNWMKQFPRYLKIEIYTKTKIVTAIFENINIITNINNREIT